MKFVNKKSLLLLVANSLLLGCTTPTNIPVQNNKDTSNYGAYNNTNTGTVKLKFDFPAKFTPSNTELKKVFGVKSIEVGKINRVRVKVTSATTSYVIERNVELVPGGVEATLSLPLDKLYTITVQGVNDTNDVSGAQIKGYFSLASSSITPNVEVSQMTTPIAKIIESLKDKLTTGGLAVIPGAVSSNALAATTNSGTVEKTNASDPATVAASAASTNIALSDPNQVDKLFVTSDGKFNLSNIDTDALVELVNRARGSSHPSLINIESFANEIIKSKGIPVEIPANPLLKPGKVKGTVSGLKYNEVAIVMINDPASKQSIVVTPPQVSLTSETDPDPDALAPDVNYVIDNVTPGEWTQTVIASGYTRDSSTSKVTVAADAEAGLSFTLKSGAWLKTPLNISGSVGNSDEQAVEADEAGNMHTVWRQDGFSTDSNSGVIYYSRWNGTSWTTQGTNISQYNNSDLTGSKDPSITVGLDRLPQIIWSAKDSGDNRNIYFNRFNGTTWQSPSVIPGSQGGIHPSIAVDKTNGFLYAAWESGDAIYLSQYDKTKWSDPLTVGNGSIPKVKVGTDGIVHVVWKSNGAQSIQYRNWTLSKSLSNTETIPMNSLGNDVGNSIDAAIDRFNRLHVVWRNDIYIQYALRSNVSWSQPEVVNQLPTALMSAKSGASISIAPTGIVNVAWVSVATDNKEVIRFRRRLTDGWKKPYKRIADPTEPIATDPTETTPAVASEILRSENIDGYEDIPLSGLTSVDGTPSIAVDSVGNINVLWSNKGEDSNDTDLLHSLKGNLETN